MVASSNSTFKKGDIVSGALDWASYTLVPEGKGLTKIDASAGMPLSYYLGVLGKALMNAGYLHTAASCTLHTRLFLTLYAACIMLSSISQCRTLGASSVQPVSLLAGGAMLYVM